jgi:hypothetical protein
MRALLSLLALLAVVINPLTAPAARAQSMHAPSAAIAKAGTTGAMPCCPYSDQHKQSKIGCAALCMAMGVSAFVVPAASLTIPVASTAIELSLAPDASKRLFLFTGLDPPPRSFG